MYRYTNKNISIHFADVGKYISFIEKPLPLFSISLYIIDSKQL